MDQFSWTGMLWRVLFALGLVFATFNPTGHSYYHWVAADFPSVQPIEAVAGVLLLILWVFLVRSTLASLGVGMGWARVRMRATGQASVDRVDA